MQITNPFLLTLCLFLFASPAAKPIHAAEKTAGDSKKMKQLVAQAREAAKRSEFETAFGLYQDAVLEADKFAPAGLKTWEVWFEAGTFFMRMQRYGEAAAEFAKGAEAVKGPRKEEKLMKAQFLTRLGSTYRFADANDEAEKALVAARDLIISGYGANDSFLAPVLTSLGTVYLQQKRYPEAEATLKRGLTLAETQTVEPFVDNHYFGHHIYKPDPMDVSNAESSLGFLNWNQKRYDEAEKYFLKSLKTIELSFGKSSPNLASHLRNLGMVYDEHGKSREAEEIFQREMAIEEKAPGGMAMYAKTVALLARSYSMQARLADLQGLFERLIERTQAAGVKEDYLSAVLRAFSARENDWEKVAQTFDVALAAGQSHFHPQNKTNNLLALMMQCAIDHKQDEAAETYGKARLAALEKSAEPHLVELSGALKALADLYLKEKKMELAEKLTLRQVEILQKEFGESDSRVARALDDYGDLLAQMGRKVQAEKAKKEAAAVWAKSLAPKS
jgi:hypothetical protein